VFYSILQDHHHQVPTTLRPRTGSGGRAGCSRTTLSRHVPHNKSIDNNKTILSQIAVTSNDFVRSCNDDDDDDDDDDRSARA
jgi:hypothetical protein